MRARLTDDAVVALARHVLRDATRSYITPRDLAWLLRDWLDVRYARQLPTQRVMAALGRRGIHPERHHGRSPVFAVRRVLAASWSPQARTALRRRILIKPLPRGVRPAWLLPVRPRVGAATDA